MGLEFENGLIEEIDAKTTFGELEFLKVAPEFVFDEVEKRYTEEIREQNILVYSSEIRDNVKITIPVDFDVSGFEYEDRIDLTGHVSAQSWMYTYKTAGRDGAEIERSEQAFKVRAAGISKIATRTKPEQRKNQNDKNRTDDKAGTGAA